MSRFKGEGFTVKWYKVLHKANSCEAVIEKTEQLCNHPPPPLQPLPYTSTARTVVPCNEASVRLRVMDGKLRRAAAAAAVQAAGTRAC